MSKIQDSNHKKGEKKFACKLYFPYGLLYAYGYSKEIPLSRLFIQIKCFILSSNDFNLVQCEYECVCMSVCRKWMVATSRSHVVKQSIALTLSPSTLNLSPLKLFSLCLPTKWDHCVTHRNPTDLRQMWVDVIQNHTIQTWSLSSLLKWGIETAKGCRVIMKTGWYM